MKKNYEKIILNISFWIALMLITYSIFTLGRASIDSDVATGTLLARSILEHKNFFPKTWNYVNGETMTLTNHVFMLFLSPLISNQPLARMIASYCLVIVTIVCTIIHSKYSFINDSWLFSVPIIFLYLISQRDMMLYQVAYPMTLVVMSIGALCISEIWREPIGKNNRKYVVIYILLIGAECALGLRYIAEQTLPMLAAVFAVSFFNNIKRGMFVDKKSACALLRTAVVIIVPAVVGFTYHIWLTTWHEMHDTQRNVLAVVDSFHTVKENILIALKNFYENFGFTITESWFTFAGLGNVITIVLCTLICFIIPFLQLIKLRNENDTVKIFFWFTVAHNIEMLILTIFFGETYVRYLLTSVIACILLSTRYVYEYWIRPCGLSNKLLPTLFLFATIVQCVNLYRAGSNWRENLNYETMVAQTLINHDLTKGYASYWNAYKYQIYSDNQVLFGGAYVYGDGLHPYYWLVDSDIFEVEEKNTFLMLDEGQNTEVGDSLEGFFGKPIETFMAGDYYVYVYDYDLMREAKAEMKN